MGIVRRSIYPLTGFVLVVLLVGVIVVLQSLLPRAPSLAALSPRARGPLEAPIQILEFSDFQCPACGVAQAKLVRLLEEYPQKIRLVYNHFPLEGHQWSMMAHRAAECAASQNQFWPYHDKLYEGQETWSHSKQVPLEPFLRYATEIPLDDLNEFASCLADPKLDRSILDDRETGIGLGVRSTPSFFVNGELIVGIDRLMEKFKKGPSIS